MSPEPGALEYRLHSLTGMRALCLLLMDWLHRRPMPVWTLPILVYLTCLILVIAVDPPGASETLFYFVAMAALGLILFWPAAALVLRWGGLRGKALKNASLRLAVFGAGLTPVLLFGAVTLDKSRSRPEPPPVLSAFDPFAVAVEPAPSPNIFEYGSFRYRQLGSALRPR